MIGVFHSHTHTDPYPSPTDVVQAPDPAWHYVLVSLRHEVASVRSYRIVDGLHRRGVDRGPLVSDRNSQLSGGDGARSEFAEPASPARRRAEVGQSRRSDDRRGARDSAGAVPGMAGQLVTEDGQLHKFVNVYLNDDDVRYMDKLDTKVQNERHHLDPARSRRRRT